MKERKRNQSEIKEAQWEVDPEEEGEEEEEEDEGDEMEKAETRGRNENSDRKKKILQSGVFSRPRLHSQLFVSNADAPAREMVLRITRL